MLQRVPIAVLIIVVATLVFAQKQQPADGVVRGRALELVDDRGQVRCRINVESTGEVVLRLVDQKGAIKVKLGAGTDGSGLVLLDETTEPGIHLIARQTAKAKAQKTTSITLTSNQGQRVVSP